MLEVIKWIRGNKKEIKMNGKERTTKARGVTYTQNWQAYNKAQNSELELFNMLLRDLVEYTEGSEQRVC